MSGQPPVLVRQRLSGALLVAGAVIGMVGNALHPHSANPDPAVTVQTIAQNGAWVGIHLAVVVAILLIIGGLVGLADLLKNTVGGPLAGLGLAAALLGGAVVSVSTAVDGFVGKALALSWVSAAPSDAALALRLSITVSQVQFGIWSIGMLVFFGATFACFGIAVSASRRFPGWFGWVAVVGGSGSVFAAVLQIVASGAVQAAETVFLASSVLLTLWIFALGVLMWRGRADVRAGEPSVGPLVADHRP